MIAAAPLIISLVSILSNVALHIWGHPDPTLSDSLNVIASAALGAHAGNQKGTM